MFLGGWNGKRAGTSGAERGGDRMASASFGVSHVVAASEQEGEREGQVARRYRAPRRLSTGPRGLPVVPDIDVKVLHLGRTLLWCTGRTKSIG